VVAPADSFATSCSCPSRKHPCKHALALLLLWTDDGIGMANQPEFVLRWLDRRAERSERSGARDSAQSQRDGALADPAAAAKRAAARRDRVSAGLDELDRWLGDQVRAGLAGLPRGGYAHFDAIAARMVDAQAPGVAGLLRGMPADLIGADWPERVLHAFGALHLLIQAHRSQDRLPADLTAIVRSRVGYPVGKDEVLAGVGVHDHWFALGAVDTVEYQLETRRVWLLGAATGRWAVWLTFAAPGQQFDPSVQPGQVVTGDLHFYPGSGQFRAVVGLQTEALHPVLAAAGVVLADVRRQFAELLAADPWGSRLPALVRGVPVPPTAQDPWRLRDASGECCELEDSGESGWSLLARSCGEPITVFGEWHGRSLLALAVLDGPVEDSERVVA